MEQIRVNVNTSISEMQDDSPILRTGSYNIDKFVYEFSEEYEGLVKKALIILPDGVSINTTIIDDELIVPVNMYEPKYLDQSITVGVYAYAVVNDQLSLRYSPRPFTIIPRSGSYDRNAVEEAIDPPSISDLELYYARFNELYLGTSALASQVSSNASAVAANTQTVEEDTEYIRENKETIEGLLANANQLEARLRNINEYESERQSNETARTNAENTRISNENARVSAETARGQAETARATAEEGRASAEETRSINETGRVSAEESRASAETSRAAAETARASAEQTRVTNENARKTAETARSTAETARATAETQRTTKETQRQTAETTRETNESTRQTNEETRQSNETARETAETARENAEEAREEFMQGYDDEIQLLADLIPTDNAEGETIDIDDSAKYYFKEVVPEGQTEQESTEGKQLLDLSATPLYSAAANVSSFINSKLILQKETASKNAFCLFKIANVDDIGNNTIYINGKRNDGKTYKVILGYSDENGENRITIVSTNDISSNTFSINMTVDATTYTGKVVVVWLYVDTGSSGAAGDIGTYEDVIVSTTNTSEWEPYTGGIPRTKSKLWFSY